MVMICISIHFHIFSYAKLIVLRRRDTIEFDKMLPVDDNDAKLIMLHCLSNSYNVL